MSDSLTPAERALLERMFTGEWTSAEKDTVAAVLQRVPEARARVEAWRVAAARADDAVDDAVDGHINADALYRTFWERVEGAQVGSRAGKEAHALADGNLAKRDVSIKRAGRGAGGSRPLSWGSQALRNWGLLAGFIACFSLVVALVRYRPMHDSGTTRTYTTTVGQRATLLLDDGTHVMLAPQTTLRLAGFGRSSRTIFLDGDAYFEVAPSARVPFIVHTGSTTTRVLGTAFAVQHYRGDAEVRIAVATGKVIVSSGGQHPPVAVTAGHVFSLADSIQTVKAVDNIDTEIGWLGDRLVFQYVPVPQVLATLTRWYGYRFRYADSMVARQNVTIALSMHSSAEALASLEQILDVSLTVVGDTVTFTPIHSRTAPHQRTKHYDMWIPTREVGR